MLIKTLGELSRLPDTFFLFSYGSNNIEILSQRLLIEGQDENDFYEIIDENTSGYILNNYTRTFFGSSKLKGNGGGGSIATIRYKKDSYVEGTRLKINNYKNTFYVGDVQINLEKLSKAEGMSESDPNLSRYFLCSLDQFTYAFIKNEYHQPPSIFYSPVSYRYLKLITKTIFDSRRKRGDYRTDISITLLDDNFGYRGQYSTKLAFSLSK